MWIGVLRRRPVPRYGQLVGAQADASAFFVRSIFFTGGGALQAAIAFPEHGWRPARGRAAWWEALLHLLGCVFFGIAAAAGYVVPATGSPLNLAAANGIAALGAVCLLTRARRLPGGRAAGAHRVNGLTRPSIRFVIESEGEAGYAGTASARASRRCCSSSLLNDVWITSPP
jgi:hypothetical protein